MLYFIEAIPSHTPTNSILGLTFLPPSAIFVIFLFVISNIFNIGYLQCEMLHQYDFD